MFVTHAIASSTVQSQFRQLYERLVYCQTMITTPDRLLVAGKHLCMIMNTRPGKGDIPGTTASRKDKNNNPTPKSEDKKSQTSGSAKKGWKKVRGSPKQPRSAYNLFYQHEREKILEEINDPSGGSAQGQMGFAHLTRRIAEKWNSTNEASRSKFEVLALQDKERYAREKKEWKEKMMVSPEEVETSSGVRDVELLSSSMQTGSAATAAMRQSPDSSKQSRMPQPSRWFPTFEPPLSVAGLADRRNLGTSTDETGGGFATVNTAFKSHEATRNWGSLTEALSSTVGSIEAMTAARVASYGLDEGDDPNVDEDDESDSQSRIGSIGTAFCYNCLKESSACLCPLPIAAAYRPPSISELASHLDNESIDFLLNIMD
jgi:hypothetical protein